MPSMLINPRSSLATAKVFMITLQEKKKTNKELLSGSSREESKVHKLGITVQLQSWPFNIKQNHLHMLELGEVGGSGRKTKITKEITYASAILGKRETVESSSI